MVLRYLRTPDNHEATVEAVTNPAQWAVLMVEECCRRRRGHGDRVDEDDVDWSDEHHPEREPREGCQHAATAVEKTVRQPDSYCLDRDACGLTLAEFSGDDERADCISEELKKSAVRRSRRFVSTKAKSFKIRAGRAR